MNISKRVAAIVPAIGLALVVAACGSSNATPTSAGGGGGQVSAAPSLGNDLGGAFKGLSSVNSYRFTMTFTGAAFAGLIPALPGSSTNSATSMSGTVIVKPARAADVTIGAVHLIEVGGQDYIDFDNSGSFIASPEQGSGLVTSYLPDQLWTSLFAIGSGDYTLVGLEQKNGVAAVHYRASGGTLTTLANAYGAGSWTADVWIAASGVYPVSVVVANGTGSGASQFKLDITNVNDPSNQVTAPANAASS